MKGLLTVSNRQSACVINTPHLKRVLRGLLEVHLAREDYELSLCLLGEKAMVQLNETYLHHAGCTDVIAFDYAEDASRGRLAGEIFVCVPEAMRQAARFRVDWRRELVRYVVHGTLHLCGYDDQTPIVRRRMKKQENHLLRLLADAFGLEAIARGRGSKR